jgi:hypothetical protein
MANREDLSVIGQSIPETQVNLRSSGAFVALGQATSQLADAVGSVFQEIHTTQSAALGEQQALEGSAPKNLPLAFGKSQKAYNQAVINTEGRQLASAGSEMILKELASSLDPSKFNAQTPAAFASKTDAIVNEFVGQARDGNRAFVAQNLTDTLNRAKLKMTENAIQFDSKQRNILFEREFTQASKGLEEALVNKDSDEALYYKETIASILDDYSVMDESIAARVPDIVDKIDQQIKQSEVVGDYLEAINEGLGAKFLVDFLQNKPENLSNAEWEQAAKRLSAMNSLNDKLINEARGEQIALVKDGINAGTVSEDEIYSNDLLTLGQKQTLVNTLHDQNRQMEAKAQSIARAQANILMGRSGALSSGQVTQMYDASVQINEQMLGRPMSMEEMADSVLGIGEVFPVSGMPGVGFGRNVPELDTLVSNQLTSGDPKSQAMGILVYNKMANLNEKPNSINLSGDALAMATLGSSLIRGNTISYEDAANVASKSVLDKKDPEVIRRRDRFAKEVAPKLEKRFKQDFGVKVTPFVTDAAFSRYSEVYQAQYVNSNSDDAAREAARYSMAGLGTDSDYPEGYVGDAPPHKTLTIAQMDNQAWNNQKIIAMQQIIDNNKVLREKGLTQTIIEWSNPDDNINVSSLTDEQKVMTPLISSRVAGTDITGTSPEMPVASEQAITKARTPVIKVNGQDSEYKLMDGPDVRFGDNGRFIYTFFYTDRSGNLQALEDVSNAKSVAQIQPMELTEYAPGVFTEQNNEKLSQQAEKIREEQLKGLIRESSRENFLMKFFSEDALSGLILKLADEDPIEAQKLIKQLEERQNQGKPADSSLDPTDEIPKDDK